MTDIVREHVTDRAHGIDVSHYQETYVYAKTIGQVDFAIAKVGEGHNVPYSNSVLGDWKDFNKIWIGGVDQLPIRGLYHYQRGGPVYSWEKQATLVLEAALKISPRPHFLALDFERANNEAYIGGSAMVADFQRIINFWRANSPYKIFGYWNPDVFENCLWYVGNLNWGPAFTNWLLDVPAWLSQYWLLWSPNKQPGTPRHRSDWDFWQYTNKGDKFVTVNNEIWRQYGSPDLDVFNGTVPQLAEFVSAVEPIPTPEPEPTPEPVTEDKPWVVITTGGARVHKTPDTAAASVVGGVLRDSTLWGSETPNKEFVELHGFVSTITVKPPTDSTPPPPAPEPTPTPSTRPTNLARVKWMFQRPETLRPNIWWKKPDILPGRIDDTTELTRERQVFWFNLLLQHRPIGWTDEQMIQAWRSLTSGTRAYTNGHGSETCQDFIGQRNLDAGPMVMDKMRWVGGGIAHILDTKKTVSVRGIVCYTAEVLDPNVITLDPLKINNALTPWLVGIATNDYKDPVTHVGGFPQLDGGLVQVPYFGDGYNLIPVSCVEMLADDAPIPSPFYDPR